jgi:hypothetical protein
MAQLAEPVLSQGRHWLTEQRIRVYSLLIVVIVGAVAAVWIAAAMPTLVDLHGKPVGYDFITFWSAARLAVDGRPEAVFDASAIAMAQHAAVSALGDMLFLWHYPPTFLLLVLPLGLLAYPAALIAFIGVTVALWAGLARALFQDPRAWLVAAATPAGLINLLDGQNGFLTAGLAGFAVIQLDRRPRLTGTLMGLLAIKPHLALLFPLALIASRRWQTFFSAALTAIVFTAISIANFGVPTTLAFLRDLPALRDVVDHAGLPWSQMPSPYVLMLSLGASPVTAALVQVVAALGAGICVWRVWRSDSAPREAQAAVLFAGSLLISPYLFTYDLTWSAVAIAFLAILGMREGFCRGERDMLFVAWLAPLVFVPLYWAAGVQLGCVVLVMLFAVAMRAALVIRAAPSSFAP